MRGRYHGLWVSLAVHAVLLLLLGLVTWTVAVVRPEPTPAISLKLEPVIEASAGTASNRNAAVVPTAPPPPRSTLPPLPVPPPLDPVPLPRADPSLDELTALLNPAVTPGPAATGRGRGRTPGGGVDPDGFTKAFSDRLASDGATGIDLVLVLDATQSMQPYFAAALRRWEALTRRLNVVLRRFAPEQRFPLRIGIVVFKGYNDDLGRDASDTFPLTPDVGAARLYLTQIKPDGRGSLSVEPVHEGLYAALSVREMDWDPRRRAVVLLLTDSNLMRDQRNGVARVVADFREKVNGSIHVIDTGGGDGRTRTSLRNDLATLAAQGGGTAVLLDDADRLWPQLLQTLFPEASAGDLERLQR